MRKEGLAPSQYGTPKGLIGDKLDLKMESMISAVKVCRYDGFGEEGEESHGEGVREDSAEENGAEPKKTCSKKFQ